MSNKSSNWKRNILMIAAAVAATAATASAQDVTLRANVPFAFSINRGANLAAGNYIVSHRDSVWRFRSVDTGEAVSFVNVVGHNGKAGEKPSVTFGCLRSRCQVISIQEGAGRLGAQVLVPGLSKSDAEELSFVNVPLEAIQGE
jgi:hypothetical protein